MSGEAWPLLLVFFSPAWGKRGQGGVSLLTLLSLLLRLRCGQKAGVLVVGVEKKKNEFEVGGLTEASNLSEAKAGLFG